MHKLLSFAQSFSIPHSLALFLIFLLSLVMVLILVCADDKVVRAFTISGYLFSIVIITIISE